MLRFHLPPNFIAAAARDAVPLRVEVDPVATPPPELIPALALLQRWSGAPIPPKFIQLSRAQLRDLAAAAGNQPIFVENGRTTAWHHDDLVATPNGARAPASAVPSPTPGQRPLSPKADASLARPLSFASSHSPLIVDGSEHFLALTLPSREHPGYADALAIVKEH